MNKKNAMTNEQISSMYKLLNCGLEINEVMFLLCVYDKAFSSCNRDAATKTLCSIRSSMMMDNLKKYKISDKTFGILILNEYDLTKICEIMIMHDRADSDILISEYLVNIGITLNNDYLKRLKYCIRTSENTRDLYESIKEKCYKDSYSFRKSMKHQHLSKVQVLQIKTLISQGYNNSYIIEKVFGYKPKDMYRIALSYRINSIRNGTFYKK